LLDVGKGAGEWRRNASAEEWSPPPDALAAVMAPVGPPALGGAGMELIGWMDTPTTRPHRGIRRKEPLEELIEE